ncbi:PTS sugar transporter subunit IIA [Enterococcus dongliensis]|nr:PTS sugar transporter subunit IIA [Enterococcus dongliensis]
MMNDNFFQILLDQPLTNRNQIQHFIATIANEKAEDELIVLLKEREKIGNTMIAEHIILPHLESPQIKKSQILLIRLSKSVDLDEETPEVQLIITILMKSDESQEIKKKIAHFTRRLADEKFLEMLLTIENEAIFYQTLEEEIK